MAHENDNNPRENPCTDELLDDPAGTDPPGAIPPPGGFEPEPPAPPAPPEGNQPFPEPARNEDFSNPGAPDPAASDRMEDNAAINEIDFSSATREVSTFNGRNFVPLASLYNSLLQNTSYNFNHTVVKRAAATVGTTPQTNPGDNFRESMLSFFTDGGDVAEIAGTILRGQDVAAQIFGSHLLPRHKREVFLYSPFGRDLSHDFFQNTNAFGFNVPFEVPDRMVRPRSEPAFPALEGESRSALFEQYIFKFRENIFLNATSPNREAEVYIDTMPAGIRKEEFYDIFCLGGRSSAWRTISEDLSQETKDFYKAGLFKFPLNNQKQLFTDFCFDAPASFYEKEVNNILISPSHMADIEAEVKNPSFYSESELLVSESEIPNVYKFYDAKRTIKNLTERTEDGTIRDIDGLTEDQESSLSTARRVVQSYTDINERNNVYQTPEVLKFTHRKVEKFKEINDLIFKRRILKRKDTSLAQFLDEGIDIAPENYVRIKINSSEVGIVNNFLKKNNLDLAILEYISSPAGPEGRATITSLLDDKFITNDLNPTSEGTVDITNNDIVVNNVKLDFHPRFSTQGLGPIVGKIQNDQINIEEYPLKYDNWDNKQLLSLDTLIQKNLFMDQLNSYIAEAGIQRTFHDIMSGKKAYSEVIGYKVLKYKVLSEEEVISRQSILDIDRQNRGGFGPRRLAEPRQLVQTFYFMDSDGVEEFEYIDSQVVPGREYEYEIYTINFVIATDYRYIRDQTFFNWQRPTGLEGAPLVSEEGLRRIFPGLDSVRHDSFTLGIITDRNFCLIPAPFFRKTVRPEDARPMAPQVTFLPYQGVEDKFAIFFDTNYGETRESRIWFRTGVQNYKINFKTDTLPSHFLCVRIEEEPSRWQDFYTSRTRRDFVVPSYGKTGFLMQDIEPNKTYYYVFRALDNYDPSEDGELPKDLSSLSAAKATSSNPTSIYKVRVVSYDAGIFMELDVHEMKPSSSKFVRKFENMLKISPAMRQKVVNFSQVLNVEASEDESTMNRLRRELQLANPGDNFEFQKSAPQLGLLSLGPSEPARSVWGRKFKFRITSKKTGKKMDLNIGFKQSKDPSPEPLS